MQANKWGFNMGANPCANGTCDAISQCKHDMNVQGVEKYGPDAYGPGGSMVNTSLPFNVKTEFISTSDYQELWALRSTMSQDGNEIVLESSCPEYLASMSAAIEGGMGFVLSAWDNTSDSSL